MAKKVSKNQRTSRGGVNKAMAKVVLAEKKTNGQFRFKDRMVPTSEVQSVIKQAKAQA